MSHFWAIMLHINLVLCLVFNNLSVFTLFCMIFYCFIPILTHISTNTKYNCNLATKIIELNLRKEWIWKKYSFSIYAHFSLFSLQIYIEGGNRVDGNFWFYSIYSTISIFIKLTYFLNNIEFWIWFDVFAHVLLIIHSKMKEYTIRTFTLEWRTTNK